MSSRHDSAPRHPRSHAGVAGRAARALTTAACALALATGALAATPSPARADDTITTQDYFSYYKLDSTRAKGYTGKGVTIAMIDGPVDTSAPELAGANITVKTPCEYETAWHPTPPSSHTQHLQTTTRGQKDARRTRHSRALPMAPLSWR